MDLLSSSVLAIALWVGGSSVALLLVILVIDDPDRRKVHRKVSRKRGFLKFWIR